MKISAYDYKIGTRPPGTIGLLKIWALIIAGLVIAVPPSGANAQRGQAAITCTNPYSGSSFQVQVNYDQSTVDSNPARISAASISWQDDKSGRKYILDRKSGNLTVILASATGGNFLYDQCQLDK